jgi:hypothetical protein
VRVDRFARGKAMIARQHDDEWLPGYEPEFEIGLGLTTHEGNVELAALQVVGERRRVIARHLDFDVEQFVAQNVRRLRQPVDFLPGEEAHGENRLGGLCDAPRGFGGRFGLAERETGVIKKGAAGGRQFYPVHAAA